MPVLKCQDYLESSAAELEAANTTAAALDLSQGLRAAVPQLLAIGLHALNAHTYALLALTVGTRTEA